MNKGRPDTDPQTVFYDLDYPWPEDPGFKEAVDDGIAPYRLCEDIAFMVRFATLACEERTDGNVLDLCCGSGRLSIPLARAGFSVTGVDLSPSQIAQFGKRVGKEPDDVKARLKPLVQDALQITFEREFHVAIVGFNSLNLITDRVSQRELIRRAAKALKPGGRLILDLLNPFQSSPFGATQPSILARRSDPAGQFKYIKSAAATGLDSDQQQRVSGWYDVQDAKDRLSRRDFIMDFRHVFAGEAREWLETAGLAPGVFLGDVSGAAFGVFSRKLFAWGEKRGDFEHF